MKKLTEYINEAMVNEALTNKFMAFVLGKTGNHSHVSNMYSWNNIPNSNFKLFTSDDAVKLYRKTNGGLNNALIIWCVQNWKYEDEVTLENVLNSPKDVINQVKFISLGTYILWSDGYYKNVSVKTLGADTSFAIAIDNIDDFSTRELRRLRQEAKKGAVTLKRASDIAKENISRYEKIIAQNNTPTIERLAAELNNANKLYLDLFNKYSDELSSNASKATIKDQSFNLYQTCVDVSREITKINRIYEELIANFQTVAIANIENTGELHGGTREWNAKYYLEKATSIINAVKKLKALLEEYKSQETVE